MNFDFYNKKIAVLGFGVEGQDACEYLVGQKAGVTVFDKKTPRELGAVYQKFSRKVHFILGNDYLDTLATGSFDFIFRSPGFRPDLPEIAVAVKKGTRLTSATKLFFDLCPGKIIGVTGTKGKGTTATLIENILRKENKKVFLAGNIGKPVLKILPQIKKEDWAVLELSSFQLIDLHRSPHIAVVLFIASEHLDYHLSTDEYIAAKTNIVKYQTSRDFSVLNYDNLTSKNFAQFTPGKVSYFSRRHAVSGAYVKGGKIYLDNNLIGKTSDLKLRGEHNWDNVCAAANAASLAGATPKSIRSAVFAFKGLEHRLEMVRSYKGIDFFNDSFSTTPETTIAAVKSFINPIILIAGGSDKGSDFTDMGRQITSSNVRAVVLLGQMAPKIRTALRKTRFSGEIVYRPKDMKEALRLATASGRPGDIVLLSPACASFDMFVDYKDRGQQFKKYVKALK